MFPGPDGRVRNVMVKTPDGDYRRPISKIAVLHPSEGFEDDDNDIIGAEDVSARAK